MSPQTIALSSASAMRVGQNRVTVIRYLPRSLVEKRTRSPGSTRSTPVRHSIRALFRAASSRCGAKCRSNPLAFVPFGVNAPALGVLALGLGLMACDGLMVLFGYACAAASAFLLFTTFQ